MGSIENEVARLFGISCAAAAASWAFQNSILSDQPVKLASK
ncbi:hypothetical protein [Leisingera sp. F5]|nr:hypothetical protein [Leisingera sp. F5]